MLTFPVNFPSSFTSISSIQLIRLMSWLSVSINDCSHNTDQTCCICRIYKLVLIQCHVLVKQKNTTQNNLMRTRLSCSVNLFAEGSRLNVLRFASFLGC